MSWYNFIMSSFNFPKDFIFGAATSAYQIEGAHLEDGKGMSIWDEFSHKKGKIKNNENGDVACDHYKRYHEDVKIMNEIGLDAYRGSISWSRVLPEGMVRINQKGLDFYDKLTDELLKYDITPFYTLFHWDLPLALQEKFGGFQSREIVDIFCEYVEVVVSRLGDRVKNWITLNEPFEYSAFGHLLGFHAPGIKSPWAYFKVMHNLLLAHGKSVPVIRDNCIDANVGITLSITPLHIKKKDKKTQKAHLLANQFLNEITLKPLFHGTYPTELRKKAKMFFPKIKEGDMETISTKIDFVGVNNYQREWVKYKPFFPIFHFDISGAGSSFSRGLEGDVEYTLLDWEVYPPSIREAVELVDFFADVPIYITENGAAFKDDAKLGGIRDPRRQNFIKEHLKELHKAMKNGVDVRAYFVWSLLDCYEWSVGYEPTFGLVSYDDLSKKRFIKDSAYWYSKVIENRGFYD